MSRATYSLRGFVGTPTMNLLKAEIRDGTALATDGRFEFNLDGAARERFGGASGPLTDRRSAPKTSASVRTKRSRPSRMAWRTTASRR